MMSDFKNFVAHLEAYSVNPRPDGQKLEENGYSGSIDTLVDDIEDGHVISSRRKERYGDLTFSGDEMRHDVVIDIDLPAMLLDSSTYGHHHLIVRLPGEGATTADYQAFLDAAARIGLIEEGYAGVFKHHGHSDVRLPWVTKGDADHPFVVDL